MSREEPVLDVGVLGGSGLYELAGIDDARAVTVETPYGPTSDAIRVGTLGGRRVGFLARHGRNHDRTPTEVPYRANVWAFKKLGARWLLSASAVGSLRESIAPRHVVLVDQFVDRTRLRPSTFFGDGLVAHVSMADPVCPQLRARMFAAAAARAPQAHDGGTYLCMEGPAFSTRAESELYRAWGMDVIGMTNLQEARLAREAEPATRRSRSSPTTTAGMRKRRTSTSRHCSLSCATTRSSPPTSWPRPSPPWRTPTGRAAAARRRCGTP